MSASPSTSAMPGEFKVAIEHDAATRLRQRVALGIVVIPFIGFLGAIALAYYRGIGAIEIASLAVMYFLAMAGVTVGYHRQFAHRSFTTSKGMRMLLAILGSVAGQGPVIFWVASHRRHHAYSDQEGDPHSPNLHGLGLWGFARGFWHAHVGWMFDREATRGIDFARDVMQDRDIFRINSQYFFWLAAGILAPALVAGLAGRSWMAAFLGFLWGGLVRIFLVNQASWCVGSVCHMFGRRPFETRDNSTNNFWVAFFTFGEGLQNNHHAFPSSAKHGLEWWEPDISAGVIRLLEIAGLVWDVRVPTETAIARARKTAPARPAEQQHS